VVREGDFHYDGGGWGGSGIGYSYGGETIQGVVPYYSAMTANRGSFNVVRGGGGGGWVWIGAAHGV
jgi:hypothetical protein